MSSAAARRDTATFEPYYWEAYNEIVEPRRFDHYLVRRWAPALGPTGFLLLKVLRDRCYHNPQTGVLRDTCEVDLDELAAAVGVSRATVVRELRNNEALGHFVRRVRQYRIVDGRPRKDANLYQISMDDPVHPADYTRYDELRAIKECERAEASVPARADTRIKREDGSSAYTAQSEPYRRPHKAQIEPTDAKHLTVQNDPTDATHLKAQIEPTLDYSPSGGALPSDSLTPPAADPPINSPQGEDGHGSEVKPGLTAVEGEESHGGAVTAEDVAGELRDSLLCAAWSEALRALEGAVNAPTFAAHVRPLRPLSLDEETGQVELLCASQFAREWLDKRHRPAIEEALSAALGRPVAVRLTSKGEKK